MNADFLNSKVTISRSVLEHSHTEVISMKPSNWVTKTKSVKSGSNIIREVLYVPNLLTSFAKKTNNNDNNNNDNDNDNNNNNNNNNQNYIIEIEDDEHFVSKLADRGFHVFTLGLHDSKGKGTFKNPDDIVKSIQEFINLRKEKIPTRNIAIIGHELSCYSVLNYLTKALEMGNSRADIGAVVLLDPPSYSATYSIEERQNILGKYRDLDFGKVNFLHESYADLSKFLSYLLKEQSMMTLEVSDSIDEITSSDGDCNNNSNSMESWSSSEELSKEYLDELALFDQEYNEQSDPSLRITREKRERKRAFYDMVNGFNEPDELKEKEKEKEKEKNKRKKVDETIDTIDGNGNGYQWTTADRWHITDQWIGRTPKRTFEVGKALSDRILVVDSILSHPSSSSSSSTSPSIKVPTEECLNLTQSQSQIQSPPCWGTVAAQEVADLYSACPVVSLHGDEFAMETDDILEVDFDGMIVKSEEEKWHQDVADVLIDWMRLLTTCNYI